MIIHQLVDWTYRRENNGSVIGFASVISDITDRKLVEHQLQEANTALEVERALLEQKNYALTEVLNRIAEQKQEMGSRLQSNVNRIILPMLRTIGEKLAANDRHILKLLESGLTDIIDPFGSKLERLMGRLTPREAEVCNMVRNGFSTKQIAETLSVSVSTVNNQRYSIRQKLDIGNDQANLATYLNSL
jgi:DNA-binding NarL/FixJ family response regulator